MHYVVLTILLCLISASLSIGLHAQTLATAGKKKITLKDFNQRYSTVKRQAITPPKPEVFLEDLIRYEIGLQEAKKRNIPQDAIVKQKVNEAIYRAFIEKSISSDVQKIKKISKSDMKKYYKNNPHLKTSHILIEFPPDSSPQQIAEARKRAEDIYKKVKESKSPFHELVKLYSDDTLSKEIGGDLGYQSRVTLVPPYYEAALKMRQNAIKGLIRTRYGFHIIKRTGQRSYTEADKRQIRAAVFDLERRKIFDSFFNNLKKNYEISINQSELKKIKQ